MKRWHYEKSDREYTTGTNTIIERKYYKKFKKHKRK